jgi:hypothetical protein
MQVFKENGRRRQRDIPKRFSSMNRFRRDIEAGISSDPIAFDIDTPSERPARERSIYMEQFIQRDRMRLHARRAPDAKKRTPRAICPAARRIGNHKAYSRHANAALCRIPEE